MHRQASSMSSSHSRFLACSATRLDYLQARAEFRSAGIQLISITQDFSNDPAGELALSMVAIFDEYHSAENAKHVKRTMLENARRGFWNGQTPSLGFRPPLFPSRRERTARS